MSLEATVREMVEYCRVSGEHEAADLIERLANRAKNAENEMHIYKEENERLAARVPEATPEFIVPSNAMCTPSDPSTELYAKEKT